MDRSGVVMRRLSAAVVIACSLTLAAKPSRAQGRVRVYGVGVPSAATARWGSRATVIFNVSVRNDSSEAVRYLIRVELEGVGTSSASALQTVSAGQIARIPVSVDVDLTRNPSGGDRLPYSVVLLDAERRAALHRFAGTLPVTPVRPSIALDPGFTPADLAHSRDIAVERISYPTYSAHVGARRPLGDFRVVVRNRGREPWAYVGDLGAEIALGTPETHLERSDRLSLVSTPLPRGLAPRDSAVLWLRIQPIQVSAVGPLVGQPAIPTDLWITVRVFVNSSYDVNPPNDALYYVFRLNQRGVVSESRTLPAPPQTVHVIPR